MGSTWVVHRRAERGSEEGLKKRALLPCYPATRQSLSWSLPLGELKLHERSPKGTQFNKSNEDSCSASCFPTPQFPEVCLFYVLGHCNLSIY